MCLSVFLAQVIGIYLAITSLSILIQQNRFKKIVHDLLINPPLIALSGSLCLLFGILIIVPHNLWVAKWPVIITLIGWLSLFRGIFRLFFPEKFVNLSKKLMETKGSILISWVMFLISIYLIWAGFTQ